MCDLRLCQTNRLVGEIMHLDIFLTMEVPCLWKASTSESHVCILIPKKWAL